MELVIEVNKNNRRIGLRPMKDFQTGKYVHRSAHLLLFGKDGKCLIAKRSANKKWYPNLWTYSVSGVVNDESYESCVKHEMNEELGIVTRVRKVFVYHFFDKIDKSFHALFTAKYSGRLKLDRQEISEVKWVSLDELSELLKIDSKKFVPHVFFGLKKYFQRLRQSTTGL